MNRRTLVQATSCREGTAGRRADDLVLKPLVLGGAGHTLGLQDELGRRIGHCLSKS